MDGQEIQHLFLHTIHVWLSFHQACENCVERRIIPNGFSIFKFDQILSLEKYGETFKSKRN